ncbi:MAG: hypothetical protein R3263_10640, partial [Myxococcota bacterium]|nr:hypothetical protein [Myxococcota bacterium]
ETLVLENEGSATVYVPEDARSGARPALRVELPDELREFRMPLGVVPEGVERDGRRLRFWGPVYPGRQEVRWLYALEPEPSDPEAGGEADARPERYVWRATVAPEASPVHVELPEGETRLEAPGATLEPLEPGAGDDEAGVAARRLAVRPPADGTLALVLRTPPARVAPEAVRPVEARLVLHADAASVDVTETHVLEVEGEGRVRSAPQRPLYRIPLPERLRDLRFGSDAASVTLQPDGEGGLAVRGRLAPGETRVELAYRLPVEDFPTAVERRFAARVPLLSVFLAETGSVVPSSERLHRRRPVRTQDLTYAHLEAFEVEPDETVRLEIDRLPPRTRLPRAAWMGLGGGLALASIVFLMMPLWRARGGGRIERAREPEAAERERQAIYEAIRDLDHDFETGKVSEEDHARLRAELRARAVALLARSRRTPQTLPGAAAEAPGAPSSPTPCASCGAVPRPDDRFCGRCGTPLAAAGEASAGPPAP